MSHVGADDKSPPLGVVEQGFAPPLPFLPRVDAASNDGDAGYPSVPPTHVPRWSQSSVVLALNFLLNMTFFIIVPSSAAYADALGASPWFSGLTIGISTLVAGLILVPFSQRYSRVYRFPMLFSCACITLGEIVYALAGVARTAWLMFLGRVVLGAGFVSWKYVKAYCTDAAIVGTKKRTMMSACLVVSQVGGMAVGPFVGGLLAKELGPLSEQNRLWNGFTACGWLMAVVFALFGAVTYFVFQDPPSLPQAQASTTARGGQDVQLGPLPPSTLPTTTTTAKHPPKAAVALDRAPGLLAMLRTLTPTQRFSVATMCWFSMVNFLVLGAWEANIPLLTHLRFQWSEYNAGNIIALGGLATLPLLTALVFATPHLQDRAILATALLAALLGLSLHLGTLASPTFAASSNLPNLHALTVPNFFASWFLVALGYNMLTTVTLSLVSKQIPNRFNSAASTLIQLSNYSGRITGALWGSTIYQVGQFGIVSLELGVTLVGACLVGFMWRKMDVARG